MDLSSLGVDTLTLGLIVVFSELTKRLLKKLSDKFKPFYILLPLIFSLIFSLLLIETFSLQGFIKTALTYAGLSAYFYDAIKKFIDKQNDKFN